MKLNHSLLLLAAVLTVCAPAGAAPKLLRYQTKVVDSNHQPLAGVVVERYRLPGFLTGASTELQLEERVTSDQAGSVSFTATNGGMFMLFARKAGLSAGWNMWLPGFPAGELGEPGDLVLTAPEAVAGVVQDAAGRPVPDAMVWVSGASPAGSREFGIPLGSQLGRKFLATRSGPKGEFRIDGLPAGASLDLGAAKAGLALDQPSSPSMGMPNLNFRAGDSKIVLTLKAAGALAGQVVREDTGAPMAGACVSVVQNEWNDAPASARTGADGRFLLRDLLPGEHQLRVTVGANAFADWVCEEATATAQAGTTNTNLKFMVNQGGVLEVAVRAPDHQPATDTVVGISREMFNQLGALSEAGLVRFRLVPGDYHLFAFGESLKGHQQQVTMVQDATNHLDLDLELAPCLKGLVLGPDGKPAPKVSVLLLPFVPTEKQTDAEGRFTLSLNQLGDASEQQHFLMVRDLAHNLAAFAEVAEDATNLTLRLEPGLTLAGTITDSQGKALTNATAQAMFRTEHMSTTLGQPVTVDGQGQVELKGLPAGQGYAVLATAKGFGQEQHNIEPADVATNRVALAPLQLRAADRRLAGRVVDAEDKPVFGAWVNGNGDHQPALMTRSDAQGRFSFEHVCVGQIQIFANTMHGQSGSATAEAGATNITIQLGTSRNFANAGGSSKLSGVIRKPDGTPAAKATVCLFPYAGSATQTDAAGRYKLGFNPEQWGGQQDVPRVVIARDLGANLAAALEVDAEATNADLKLEPALALAGRATDTNGKPLTNATAVVMLQAERFGSSLGMPVPVDAQGGFEVKALPLGRRYTVTVSAKGYGQDSRSVEPAEGERPRVELEPMKLLPADRKLAGVVLDSDDQPVANASLYGYEDKQPDLSGKTDSKGRFSFDHVCAGAVRLSVNDPRGGYANVSAEGGDTNMVVHLSAASGHRGGAPRLARLQGKPLPDLAPLGVAATDCPKDQRILAALIDAEQRPSRRVLRLLGEQAAALKQKGVAVVVLQAGGMADDAFAAWKKEAALPFPTGCIKGEPEKARAAWGAGALPWLVLTDKDHRVMAEGFSLDELDAKLGAAAK